MCALCSQKKQHRKALAHAQNAIKGLSNDLEELHEKVRKSEPDSFPDVEEQVQERQSLLAIAFYNLGC